MLKNIRLHLEKDEEKQAALDEQLAKQVIDTMNSNINAFQRNIPSLIPYVNSSKLTTYSVFTNRFGETNIVDYSIGRTFYGLRPTEEIQQQVAQTLEHCFCVDFTDTKKKTNLVENSQDPLDFKQLQSFKTEQALSPMPDEVECLVVLGCGLGLHIKQLLEQRIIKNLIIYEPEIQYFQCSVLATPWQDIFALAKKRGTSLFLQLLKDGRELAKDINELKEHESFSHFHIYKHYNQQVFDSIYQNLTERDWSDISINGLALPRTNSHLNFIPLWTPKINLAEQVPVSTEFSLFKKNLEAFKEYFPEIYVEYKDYLPKTWLPIISSANEVNVLETKSLRTWYGPSPKYDCIKNFENFSEQPNIDGLKLGYNQTKLAHYIHYQFVNDTQKLLKDAEKQENAGELPETIASIIVLGLGVGYQLEQMLNKHRVEKLFICEPNPDFFYASLFAINWRTIFDKAESADTNIYLNVGGDGTDFFNGLLEQFHAIGSYLLNNTFIYQGYDNALLSPAIAELREHLQIVIAIGENFDYTYYAIEHMKEGFRRNIPVLIKNPSNQLCKTDKEVPIFIIGNGPSLDNSIEAIKEYRAQAIVISCGTALQALHRHNITPDFHAEVEKNRSTFDWAVLVGDLEYLKNITLISTNGIHPDTCALYKDVLIAFKAGESSTLSALNVLGKDHFEIFEYSYPTVSNFVSNLFSVLGFNNIYLMGVDLGFVDVNHHHSKSSGYYIDGQETYDYAKQNDTSLIVPGNFRKTVNTKYEFKMSCTLIEKVTKNKPKEQTFYNCSDGARIKGTTPLEIDNLLIMASTNERDRALACLKNKAFSNKHSTHFIEKFEKRFSQDLLLKEMQHLQNLVEEYSTTPDDINKLINAQKELLFDSYQSGRSLLFYYMYGTVNYANAVLLKLRQNTELFKPDSALHKCIDLWGIKLDEISNVLNVNYVNFDSSNFSLRKREKALLAKRSANSTMLVISSSDSFSESLKLTLVKKFSFNGEATFSDRLETNNNKQFDYVIVFQDKAKETPFFKFQQRGTRSTIFMLKSGEMSDSDLVPNDVTYCPIPVNETETIAADYFLATYAVLFALSEHDSPLILLKYSTKKPAKFGQKPIKDLIDLDRFVDFSSHIACFKNPATQNFVSNAGTRGNLINRALVLDDLIIKVISDKEFTKIMMNNTINKDGKLHLN